MQCVTAIKDGAVSAASGERILQAAYHFLDKGADASDLVALKNVPWLLLVDEGRLVTSKEALAEYCGVDLRPYFYVVPSSFRYKRLLRLLRVADKCTSAHLFSVLGSLQREVKNQTLNPRQLSLALNVAQKLAIACDGKLPAAAALHLPDEHGFLRHSSTLLYNDTPGWLRGIPAECATEYTAVHAQISHSVARNFRVPSVHEVLQEKHMGEFEDVEEFGQSESLCNRIKGILLDYPGDTAIFKELIQNADDAGESEPSVQNLGIKDFVVAGMIENCVRSFVK